MAAAAEQPPADPVAPEPSRPYAGYLQKLGEGLIKQFRTRWFVLHKGSNQLFYYRDASEKQPLGFINIATASLTFDGAVRASSTGNEGSVGYARFFIKTKTREYVLEAENSLAMNGWLSAIQECRKLYLAQHPVASTDEDPDDDDTFTVVSHFPAYSKDNITLIGALVHPPTSLSQGLMKTLQKGVQITGSVFSATGSVFSAAFSRSDDPPRDTTPVPAPASASSRALSPSPSLPAVATSLSSAPGGGGADAAGGSSPVGGAAVANPSAGPAVTAATGVRPEPRRSFLRMPNLRWRSADPAPAPAPAAAAAPAVGLAAPAAPTDQPDAFSNGDIAKILMQQNAILNDELLHLLDARETDARVFNEEIAALQQEIEGLWATQRQLLATLRMTMMPERQLPRLSAFLADPAHATQELLSSKEETEESVDEHGSQVSSSLFFVQHALLTRQMREDKRLDAWVQYLDAHKEGELQQTDMALRLLVQNGIPDELRPKVWRRLVHERVSEARKAKGEGYYRRVLGDKEGKYNSATKQIDLDLLRTFPSHPGFKTMQSEYIPRLRRVLTAFSWCKPEIGYCQGLNMIAAMALRVLRDEDDAFWCLVNIVEHIQPSDYYTVEGMAASLADQGVLNDLIQSRLPRLHAHFLRHGISTQNFAFNWFVTVFADCVPFPTAERIWDVLLLRGAKVPFRMALAILKLHEENLLKLSTFENLFNYVKAMASELYDADALCKTAVDSNLFGLTGFSMKEITSLRTHHLGLVKKQLEETKQMRKKFHEASVFSSAAVARSAQD